MAGKIKDLLLDERILVYLDGKKLDGKREEEKSQMGKKKYRDKRQVIARPNILSSILSSMAEGMMDTILVVNPQTGLVEYANRAALRLFDCQPEDLIGHPPDIFAHPETRLKFRQEIINGSQEEGGWEGEIKNLRKNGEHFVSRLRAFSLRDEDGLPWMLIVVHRDLTGEKNLHEQLLKVNELSTVERRARETAHEFNNLTTILHGYVDFMLQKGGLSSELEKDLKTIQSASQRASSIARQLLDLTRPPVAKKIYTQLAPLVQDTFRIVSQDFKAHGIQTEIIHDQTASVLLDPAQISQVLLNLCINAQHAMSEAPRKTLRIETGQVENLAFLKVSDTGCGIPKENEGRIFQPLFTTKSSMSEKNGSGNGLGLAISRKIIEDHGGSINVQSRVGEGTVFTIYLPVPGTSVPGTSAPGTPVSGSPATGRHLAYCADQRDPSPQNTFDFREKMILVVDDESSLRDLIKKALELWGGRVDAVEGGKEGFQMLQEKKYDLVLLDLQLQDIRGESLLDLINSLPESDRPVKMVMSGKIVEKSQGRLNDLDVFALLTKPFALEELYTKVSAALENIEIQKQQSGVSECC